VWIAKSRTSSGIKAIIAWRHSLALTTTHRGNIAEHYFKHQFQRDYQFATHTVMHKCDT
jgi:hypothetical protein